MQQPTASAVSISPAYTFTGGTLTIDQPAAPATLAELARLGVHYQIRPTARGLGGPVSDPQHRALAVAAEQGRVLRGGKSGQASVRVLTALARQGLLVLTAFPGARAANWAYGEITEPGRRVLARLDAETGRTSEPQPTTTAADPFAMCRGATSAEFDAIEALFPC